mgnify:CR=1 FL=1|tara:strand:- start:80 stop:427 length:348 start_codon:yes stop_codon:yes gene_type:complete
MIKNSIIKTICISSLLLIFSCSDLKKISNQMETIKGNQDIMIAKQKEVDQKIVILQNSIKNLNLASKQPAKSDPKKQQKRKNADPNYVHNIDIGESVVLGNPDAKVVITKFTDFQ